MFVNLNEPLSIRWDQEHHLQIHHQKLKKIKRQKNFNLSSVIARSPSPKYKVQPYVEIARFRDILRQNQILYERLAQISKKKRMGNQTVSPQPKSMNYKIKKQNEIKILAENEAILKRITERGPFISFKQSKDEFDQVMQLRKMISKERLFKINKLPKFDGKTGHLPPLDKIKQTDKSFSHSERINLNDTININEKSPKSQSFIRKNFLLDPKHTSNSKINESTYTKTEISKESQSATINSQSQIEATEKNTIEETKFETHHPVLGVTNELPKDEFIINSHSEKSETLHQLPEVELVVAPLLLDSEFDKSEIAKPNEIGSTNSQDKNPIED